MRYAQCFVLLVAATVDTNPRHYDMRILERFFRGIQGSSGGNVGASGNDPTLGDYPYLPPPPL